MLALRHTIRWCAAGWLGSQRGRYPTRPTRAIGWAVGFGVVDPSLRRRLGRTVDAPPGNWLAITTPRADSADGLGGVARRRSARPARSRHW